MMTQEQVLRLIRNLIKHEQGARQIGNAGEAANFAAKIQALLIKYKISAAEVEPDEERGGPNIGHEKTVTGRGLRYGYGVRVPLEDSQLMAVVAPAHFCRAILEADSNEIYVFGEDQDRAVCIEMFRFLSSTMKRLARQDEQLTKRKRKTIRRFKPFFYRGFIHAIDDRYQAMRAQADGESTALVRCDHAVELYVRMFAPDVNSPKATKRRVRVNRNAYFAGLQRGREVSLGTNAVEGESQTAVSRRQEAGR